MEIFVLLLLGVILFFAVIYRLRNDKKTVLINRIPGPKCYPILGTTLPVMLMTKPERFVYLRSLVQKFGPLYRTWLGRAAMVNLADPNYVELILNNTTHNEKGIVYNFVLPWLGNGLITSKGTKWHQHRKLITPTFHFQILETFMDVFVAKSKLLVKLLESKADGITTFDIFPYITHCTLDIIAETAMGIQVNAMLEEDNRYAQAVSGLCGEFANRAAKGWLSYDFIYYKTSYGAKFLEYLSTLHNTTNKVIHERRILRQKTGRENVAEDEFGRKKRRAFLDLLMDLSQNENALTEREIKEEVNTFMFAGHDTTTSSTSWTLFLLGLHQDIQVR
ncbi:cytochrome P450 [Oryctes borbonicus]|uniref:Cytochrome P450 n=1 Tax=Oryctes borbonicus TaxID=1629725 RepID=A0A0T6ATS4_9SCAR|nr:cytochrome P450 [Oryctes borbonicus]